MVFNPGVNTLARLFELAHEVDFAAFIFARDDWTAVNASASPAAAAGQASPRDNVVFEAGLFGGVLGMRRNFILHASGAKLPTDLLGLTCVRYGETLSAADMRAINQKLRKAIEDEGRLNSIEGLWWQFSLTARGPHEPSAISLLRVSRDRGGALEVRGRSWQEDGTCQRVTKARHRRTKAGPACSITGEESVRVTRTRRSWRAREKFTWSRRIVPPATGLHVPNSPGSASHRTSGVYLRADPEDLLVLDGNDDQRRADLIADRLARWKSIINA